MQRHEHDRAAVAVELVGVGHEADLLEEVVDRSPSRAPSRRARRGSRAVPRPRPSARPAARRRSPTARAAARAPTRALVEPRPRARRAARGTTAMPFSRRRRHARVVGPAQRVVKRQAVTRRPRVERGRPWCRRCPAWARSRTRLTLTSSAGFTTALQVGERVLDLAPVVEPRAADDLVRDARRA